jgi:hypothetical protein
MERSAMKRLAVWGLMIAVTAVAGGCVERRIKVNTTPQGAAVVLNDEQLGMSPVSVAFQWYGDYNVRIAKQGYETLVTHRALKAPWYDSFPFDFFAEVLWPGRIVDSYEWTFELKPLSPVNREALIQRAEMLQKEAATQ